MTDKIDQFIDERFGDRPAWVVVVELFLGFGWIRAAVSKILSSRWWGGDPIREFAEANADHTLPYYRPVIEHIITPTIVIVAVATVALQVFIGATILLGRWNVLGLLLATALNINIIVAGGVDPSIFYLILQAALGLWIVEAHMSGKHLDHTFMWGLRAAALVAITAAPFVKTLQPKDVIEDPAAVLATYGACVAAACFIGRRNLAKS